MAIKGLGTKEELLHAHGISKWYGAEGTATILKDISLSVRRAETVAIVGRSGEGKTTLLHILGILEKPSRGSLTILGQPVSRSNREALRRTGIGFIFQGFHLLDECTALENVLIPAQISRQAIGKNSAARARALGLLERVGLSKCASRDCKLLSGGEKQRVALARALMNDPSLILADEPTGNLDHATSLELQTMLLAFAKEQNKGLIVVTHDREFAKRCSTQYVLSDGALHETRGER